MNQDYKTLFLRQSYLDSFEEYKKSLIQKDYPVWDFVVLTSSNEEQAKIFREQISMRLEQGFLPKKTEYIVVPDPDGKRVGSGGATLNVIKCLKENHGISSFNNKKILLIHSGGNSIRIPQYSVCGKLFSPVPRALSDSRRSTVFDEFIITMTVVPSRMVGGMLVLSGDVLLLFNPLQIDFYSSGAAALSFKADLDMGKNHGVFLHDNNGNVSEFLHKLPKETLIKKGATDENSNVNIDTGAVIFSGKILDSLYSLVDCDDKFNNFVNEGVRLNLYSDFIFPFGNKGTKSDYLVQEVEGTDIEGINNCRDTLWQTLHGKNMKLTQFSHAEFIHFGTSHELRNLVVDNIKKYKFIDWSGQILTNAVSNSFSANNSYVFSTSVVGDGTYIEDSFIGDNCVIGKNCIISSSTLVGVTVPDNTVLHCIKLNDGRFTARLFGVNDNPKEKKLFGKDIPLSLWKYEIYPIRDTAEQAIKAVLSNDTSGDRISLEASTKNADISALFQWQKNMRGRIVIGTIYEAIKNKMSFNQLKEKLNLQLSEDWKDYLFEIANTCETEEKIRMYYYLSKLYSNETSYCSENRCFESVCEYVLENNLPKPIRFDKTNIRNEVTVNLPVRVNWGGGWSDTPPYCIENGGNVLNAAITFDGSLPIKAVVKRIDEPKIILASTDNGSYQEFINTDLLYDCRNPNDAFSIHKSALIVSGILPYKNKITIEELLEKIGGGLYIATEVINIPRGSGLGTSSILASACIKALYEFFGNDVDDSTVFSSVLCMEQIMSTGGGWQDQVGGIVGGIKMVSSKPGKTQHITSSEIKLSVETQAEFENRFCLIYTGQRRLARNLLREVMGKYIAGNEVTLKAMREIQRIAVLMKFELERGNLDSFAKLLNDHWDMLKKIDHGCTNACIDQILLSCEDLIDGKMICGAGGGGFLQVVLKKGITTQMLSERLDEVFADSGVEVRTCRFHF